MPRGHKPRPRPSPDANSALLVVHFSPRVDHGAAQEARPERGRRRRGERRLIRVKLGLAVEQAAGPIFQNTAATVSQVSKHSVSATTAAAPAASPTTAAATSAAAPTPRPSGRQTAPSLAKGRNEASWRSQYDPTISRKGQPRERNQPLHH